MHKPTHASSGKWLTGVTATLAAISSEPATSAGHSAPPPKAGERWPVSLQRASFHRENVLGTSFELRVDCIRDEDAAMCEQQVLAEIERLNLILSTYEPASEISRVRAGLPVSSPELAEVLTAYDLWTQRTDGAINVNMAEVIRLWKGARESAPSAQALKEAFAMPRAYNIDALGKGYVIDRAVSVAKRFAPAGLLNIGGDVRVWGASDWCIGIADPAAPAENSPVLGSFRLRNGAVATSGGYSRFVTLNRRLFSHIIDPRTLHPADGLASATILAADCLTANAISTAANVLGWTEGIRLAKQFGAWGYLLADGRGQREASFPLISLADSSGLADGSKPAGSVSTNGPTPAKLQIAPADGPAWPANFEVKIDLNLKAPAGGRAKRPYVVVWIEDSNRHIVRTISIWGNEWKYLRELSSWWKAGDAYTDAYTRSVTRATRAPGAYTVVWDGLNDAKEPMVQGEYKIFVEINREHGRHVVASADIHCGAEAGSVEIKATAESEAGKLEYGPKAQ